MQTKYFILINEIIWDEILNLEIILKIYDYMFV